MAQHFDTVDDYIPSQPGEVQGILQEIRRRALTVVPGAGEIISYGIPTITLDAHHVVYFAAWKHHISIYPAPNGDDGFERDIAPFRATKGTLKFPLGKPMPYELIEKVASLHRRSCGAGTWLNKFLDAFLDARRRPGALTFNLHGGNLRVCRPST
jgi:uncharacterized protein YdhG (YjbR/CyaY superfamily)